MSDDVMQGWIGPLPLAFGQRPGPPEGKEGIGPTHAVRPGSQHTACGQRAVVVSKVQSWGMQAANRCQACVALV